MWDYSLLGAPTGLVVYYKPNLENEEELGETTVHQLKTFAYRPLELNSREEALSRFFYISITLVCPVPHGYDLYRVRNFHGVDDSYIYTDPAVDYYSTAWDFIIPVLGLFLATIIYLQQRFGGRCFLPRRFQESVINEELPMASEDQFPLKTSN
ncbi:Uncharacterized protein TCM_031501 [Theobroma cacao]|uniref:RING-type E3 ubiquitin transferase n=1 Tax=Theobroma cacao TaxID=3641 RepID=A0A061F6J7_THECC|nr:Uncharacterized protein TCM_031501 [Theobroma cacao]